MNENKIAILHKNYRFCLNLKLKPFFTCAYLQATEHVRNILIHSFFF